MSQRKRIVGGGSVSLRSLTQSTLSMIEGFEMTDQLVCFYSESFGGTQDKLREESFSSWRFLAHSTWTTSESSPSARYDLNWTFLLSEG